MSNTTPGGDGTTTRPDGEEPSNIIWIILAIALALALGVAAAVFVAKKKKIEVEQ